MIEGEGGCPEYTESQIALIKIVLKKPRIHHFEAILGGFSADFVENLPFLCKI